MLDLVIVILFCWIFFKAIGLAFRVAWGLAKIVACLLFILAAPLLIVCLVFTGGLLLLVPLALIGIAFGLLKACI